MTAHTASLTAPITRRDDLFFGGMGMIIALLVFLGFAPTFFLASRYGGPPLSVLRIVHGTLFTSWIVLYNVQALLIANDRVRTHRTLGVLGAAMATAMVPLGIALAITAVKEGHSPPGIPPLVFLAIPLFDMVVFAPLVAAGIYYRRRGDIHKRLMLLATVSLTAAAVARMSRMIPIPAALIAAGPLFYFGACDALIVAIAGYDLISRGRVHRVTLWGGVFIIASQVGRLALCGTHAWLAFATLVTSR
jgi:hypothetical protein